MSPPGAQLRGENPAPAGPIHRPGTPQVIGDATNGYVTEFRRMLTDRIRFVQQFTIEWR